MISCSTPSSSGAREAENILLLLEGQMTGSSRQHLGVGHLIQRVHYGTLQRSRLNLGLDQCFLKHPTSMIIPCCEKSKKNQVNLGTLFRLTLCPGELRVDKKSLTRGMLLHQDFGIYDIRHHTYRLIWEVILVVGGNHKISDEDRLEPTSTKLANPI